MMMIVSLKSVGTVGGCVGTLTISSNDLFLCSAFIFSDDDDCVSQICGFCRSVGTYLDYVVVGDKTVPGRQVPVNEVFRF